MMLSRDRQIVGVSLRVSASMKANAEAHDFLTNLILNDETPDNLSPAARRCLADNYQVLLIHTFSPYCSRYKDLIMYGTPCPTPSEFIPRLSRGIVATATPLPSEPLMEEKVTQDINSLLYSTLPAVIGEVINYFTAPMLSDRLMTHNYPDVNRDIECISKYLNSIIYLETNPATLDNEYFSRAALAGIAEQLKSLKLSWEDCKNYAEYIYANRAILTTSRYELVRLLHAVTLNYS